MNKSISDFARKQILEGLLRLPESHKDLFMRFYRDGLPETPQFKMSLLRYQATNSTGRCLK